MSSAASSFAPVAAPTGRPMRLAMQRLWLTGQVLPVGARLVAQHVFQSDEERPLEVIYSFPLPRDAALRRFRITGDGFETHSELKETEEAVKAYEQGIADGSLSALARQYGDGIVNLTVGNIRPKEKVTVHVEVLTGVELRDDGFRFRFPFTLAPAYHSKMRAAVTAGDGEMELPPGEFGDLILPRFREDASSLHEVGFELSVLHQLSLEEIGSPSHSISVKPGSGEAARVALAPEKDVPNRDLILDVRFKENKTQVLAGAAGDGKTSFAIIVPSAVIGSRSERPRRTVILLDRSGSMQGDRPGELPETRVVPVGMPQDTAFSAYFDRPAYQRGFGTFSLSPAPPLYAAAPSLESAAHFTETVKLDRAPRARMHSTARRTAKPAPTTKDDLIDLAAMLEPDGGMPGDSPDVRAARTIAAILAFVAEGHTPTTGAFRLHVTRLVGFLKSLSAASDREVRLIGAAIEAASTGKAPDGQWLSLAREPGTRWKDLEATLRL